MSLYIQKSYSKYVSCDTNLLPMLELGIEYCNYVLQFTLRRRYHLCHFFCTKPFIMFSRVLVLTFVDFLPLLTQIQCALNVLHPYRRHIPKLTEKNGPFCNREHPNLFIQRSSINIMDVLHHKRFGCSAVYDKDFLRRDESSGFWAKMDEIWIILPS